MDADKLGQSVGIMTKTTIRNVCARSTKRKIRAKISNNPQQHKHEGTHESVYRHVK